jgi:hypothetical protein
MSAQARPCKRCRKEIPAERMEAMPGTTLCIECSQKVGGEFDYSFTQESLGKAGSLKKNYGSVTIKKTRKPAEKLE